jgi:diaminohydroxyphosphoribosylaminopyrimidine deaminase/5-amino-6-(5-phosphoribosylamino)uracil reductase
VSRLRRGRPWVRLKLAASLDGRTALAGGESRWITSEAARLDVQRWRAESAAVLSGVGTVLADDPSLDVRIGEAPRRQPLRVVLDSRLRTPATARLFASGGEVLLLTVAGAREGGPEAATLRAAGARVEGVPADATGRPELGAVLRRLASLHVNEAWVEAGPTLAGALLDAGLVDELILYLAPTLLGPQARPLARIAGPARLAERRDWRIEEVRQIGPDVRMILRP